MHFSSVEGNVNLLPWVRWANAFPAQMYKYYFWENQQKKSLKLLKCLKVHSKQMEYMFFILQYVFLNTFKHY